MDRRYKILFGVILVVVIAMSMLLVACDDDKVKEAESTITFESNGGSLVSSIKLVNGEEVKEPTKPTKPGYDFAGWYANEELTIRYEFSVMPAGGAKLYAKWVAKPIPESTITFVSNGGTAVEPITATDGSVIIPPAEPIQLGFRFMGWCVDEELTRPYTFSTMPAGGLKLFAKWAQLYAIRFESHGGTAVDAIVDIKGAVITKPSDPTRYGYKFAGWFFDDMVFSRPVTFERMPENDIKVYAKWTAKTSNITLDNGEEGITDFTTATYDMAMPNITELPTKAGYTFAGYFDGEGVQYYDEDGLAFVADGVAKKWDKEGDYTLYARWTPITYTVRFDINAPEGATIETSQMDDVTFTYREADGDSNILPSLAFKITGYTFLGWAKTNVGEVAYTDRGEVLDNLANTQDDVVMLYAKWQANTYNITYHVNNGEVTTDTATYTYGVGVEALPTSYTKVGYTFAGWYTNEQCTEGETTAIDTKATGDKIFYAKWRANQYTVHYDVNAPAGTTPGVGTIEDSKFTCYADNNVLNNCTITIEGYTFDGWSKSPTLEDNVIFTAGVPISAMTNLTKEDGATVTLYAVWTANKYNITYHVNNGEVTTDTATYTYGVGVEALPTSYTKVGYTFAGWYTNEQCTEGETTAIDTKATGDKIFYAKWTPITYTIHYNVNAPEGANVICGEMANSTFTYDGENALTASTLDVDGYVFKGWSDSIDGVVKYSDGETITTNLTSTSGDTIELYAVWELAPVA